MLPEIEFETAPLEPSAEQRAAIWKLRWDLSGKVIDKIFRRGDLHELSRTIDDFVDGNAISNKSIDLSAATYQKFRTLLSRVNKCLDELERYQGTDWGGDEIKASQIINHTLRVVIPNSSMTAIQEEALKAATRIARGKRILSSPNSS